MLLPILEIPLSIAVYWKEQPIFPDQQLELLLSLWFHIHRAAASTESLPRS